MVMDFLEQLSAAIPSTEGEIEDVLCKRTKPFRKLVLRSIDRKKLSNEGYDCVWFVSCLHLLSCVRRAFGTRAQVFPRGMGASIMPFGRDH